MRRDKQGILPTVGALLVCAALLGGPVLWARLGDARRTQLVTARPVTAGALDEDARAIPVLYELHAGSTCTDPDAPAELPEPDPAELCAEAAEPLAALAEAGALNLADNTDAKLETLREIFDSAKDASGWLGYNRLFESNIRKTVCETES